MFLRMFICIFLVVFLFNVSLVSALVIWIKMNETGQIPVEKLMSHEKYSWMGAFYPAITLTVVTGSVIYYIVDFRFSLQQVYFRFHMRQEREKGSSYLKMRTIEIECNRASHSARGSVAAEPAAARRLPQQARL